MYNRYIPQPDGSFHRRPTPDTANAPPLAPHPAPNHSAPVRKDPSPTQEFFGIRRFFRNILPAGFDTADLIVVLLLLLMAEECQEEQNTALLTLALYLFL